MDWIYRAPNSTNDLVALEQTIKLGDFSGLTLIDNLQFPLGTKNTIVLPESGRADIVVS